MKSASKELRETAITGIVALTVRSESAALEKIVKCLLHHLSGTSFLFFFFALFLAVLMIFSISIGCMKGDHGRRVK